jgi:hypothetical protein
LAPDYEIEIVTKPKLQNFEKRNVGLCQEQLGSRLMPHTLNLLHLSQQEHFLVPQVYVSRCTILTGRAWAAVMRMKLPPALTALRLHHWLAFMSQVNT